MCLACLIAAAAAGMLSAQLLVNLTCVVIAGVLVLWVRRLAD